MTDLSSSTTTTLCQFPCAHTTVAVLFCVSFTSLHCCFFHTPIFNKWCHSPCKINKMYIYFSGTFNQLLDEVEGWFSPGRSNNGRSITPKERILIFLMFLASNSLGWISRYGHEMSAGAIHSCIHYLHHCVIQSFRQEVHQIAN